MAQPSAQVLGVNIAIWLLSNCVLVPVEVYYAYQFYDYRASHIINKRKPGILLLSIGSAIIFYFLFQTVILAIEAAGQSPLDQLSVILYHIILPFWYISWFTFIARLWLLYFTIQHSVATINNEWQQVVCSMSNCDNWYLTEKHTIGTWTPLKKRMAIYALCTYLVDILFAVLTIQYKDDEGARWAIMLIVGSVKALLSTLIPMAFLVYMTFWIKQLHFHDNIGLGRELRFCTIAYLAILLIRLVDFSISVFSDGTEHTLISVIVALEFFLWKLVGFLISLLQTKWPLKTFRKVMHNYSSRALGQLAHAKTLMNVNESKQSSLNEKIKMRVLLEDKKSFDLFMAYCASEHCIECVLSLIEMTQFKEAVQHHLEEVEQRGNEVADEIAHEEDSFVLPDRSKYTDFPRSEIVCKGKDNFKAMAHALFEKYIRVGCDWEINISYFERRKLTRLFEHEDQWLENKEYDDNFKLYQVFDTCSREMTTLIRAAFSRFKQSDTFKIAQSKSKTLQRMSVGYEDEDDLDDVAGEDQQTAYTAPANMQNEAEEVSS